MNKLKVTVNDILHRDLFKHATLLAGEEGKNREIKWTHILEMDTFDSFINGGELILTTGSNIQLDSSAGIPKIKKLIEREVAGICIELGTHVRDIDPTIIEIANQHKFPIITFTQIVKFVDITQDLHTIIINSHYQQLIHLHVLSNQLNELSLEPNGILKILTKLYSYLGNDVLLVTDDKKLFYYPLRNKEHTESVHSLLNNTKQIEPYKDLLLNNEYYTVFPIKGLGHSWGNLCLQRTADELDEFTFSILDRASIAIAQILLRDRTIEERKQNQEEELVQKMLHGEKFESTAALKFLPSPAENLYYRLIIIENNSLKDFSCEAGWEEIKLRQSIILRSLFKKHGFFPAISVSKNKISIIASFYKSIHTNKDIDSFSLVIQAIRNVYENNIFHGEDCFISASSLQKDYSKLRNCYTEAKEVLKMQKKKILNISFFEDIGVFRLLTKLNQADLEAYVSDYLGPLLELEAKTKSDLLRTLSVYFETMGSKKETSNRLFIVRQTLYHRLDKIEELLGDDFMAPTNRQAIELAISAYTLLNDNLNIN